MTVTVKGIIAIGLLIAILVAVALAGRALADNFVFGTLISLLLGSLFSVGAILFSPFRDWLEEFVNKNIRRKRRLCRILIYGMPRSGKTTLIKRWLTKERAVSEKTTSRYNYYEEEIRVKLEPSIKCRVAIADYKGQKPSQVYVDPNIEFFGPPGHRLVNFIVFVADLFPELVDRQGEKIGDEELVEEYKENAHQYIKKRVEENSIYLSEWSIESVFEAAYSEDNLWAVRLFVNKIDILRTLVSRGYLPGVTVETIPEYVLQLYKPVEERIREACQANGISDFSTHLVSALTGEDVQPALGEILEKCVNRNVCQRDAP